MKSFTFTVASVTLVALCNGLPASQSGCNTPLPKDVLPDHSVNRTLEHSASGEPTRKYRIHLPPGYDNTKAVPLILSFHGRTQDALYQEKLSKFSDASYGFQGISVYPEGVPLIKGNKPPIQQWQGDPDSHGISDTTFTLELLTHLQRTYCIDASRIYATGKSNGAAFTSTLACNATTSAHFAAFAAVAPAIYLTNSTGSLPDCKPGKKVNFMELHGMQDPVANYTGGLNSRSNGYTADVPAYVNAWAARDGLVAGRNDSRTLCGAEKGRAVTKYTWDEKESVVHLRYENVAHDWMSAVPNEDSVGEGDKVLTCKEAEATKVVLEWFGKCRL